MKIFILECTEEELKANRGIMDSIVDTMSRFTDAFWGSYSNKEYCTNPDCDDDPVECYGGECADCERNGES